MPHTRRRSTDVALAPLVDALHAAALDGGSDAWSGALERIADAFNAGAVYLQPYGGGTTWGHGGPIAVRVDPSWGRSYAEYYGALDPVLPVVIPSLAPGEATAGRQAIEPSALWRTEYGNDWCRPQGMEDTAIGLLTRGDLDPDGGWGILVLSRGAGADPFGPGELRRLEALLPHVRRAVAVGLRLGAAAAERDALAVALERLAPRGAMLVDAQGRVVFASRAAEAFLACPGAPLERAAGGALRAPARVPARVDAELRRLLAAATGVNGGLRAGGSMRLPSAVAAGATARTGADSEPAAVLEVVPLDGAGGAGSGRPAAVVLVDVPRPPPLPSAALCRDVLGFTPAEARVALLLAERGLGVPALACELGVSPSTARTHLHRLFEKTGTHRQAELAVLLRSLAAPR